jgi:pimeloyl-ACP methyl ester carboxylesterase
MLKLHLTIPKDHHSDQSAIFWMSPSSSIDRSAYATVGRPPQALNKNNKKRSGGVLLSISAIHLTKWSRLGASDPAVVMVHGSAQGSEVGGDRHFAAQSRLALNGWQVVVPDRPGHGRSPAPGRPDDAEADGLWVADLLGEGAHLVGHSFGGCVALAAATLAPDAVLSLTLIEPAMQMLAGGEPRVQPFLKEMMAIFGTSSSTAELATNFARLVNIPPEIRGGASQMELEKMGEALRQLKLPNRDMLSNGLASVKQANIPLLLVTGGWNPAFEATAEMAANLGGGRHVVIESEHHFPQLISNEFNELLAEFMTASVRPGRTTGREGRS